MSLIDSQTDVQAELCLNLKDRVSKLFSENSTLKGQVRTEQQQREDALKEAEENRVCATEIRGKYYQLDSAYNELYEVYKTR